jgi:hypothetical protein
MLFAFATLRETNKEVILCAFLREIGYSPEKLAFLSTRRNQSLATLPSSVLRPHFQPNSSKRYP